MFLLPWNPLSNHYLSTGEVSHSSQQSPPLLLYFAGLTGHLHAEPSGSTCLPALDSGIMRNIRRGLLALLYVVSSCCGYDWAEPTGKCLWSVRQKFGLSRKQLCLHCSLLWLHHHNSVVRDLHASSSFPLKGSMWAREWGAVCSHMSSALQGQYVTLKVRYRLVSRAEIHCLVIIM